MGLALQKSVDGGATFQQVSVATSHYTLIGGEYANKFSSIKTTDNNTWILALRSDYGYTGRIINISPTGVVKSAKLNWTCGYSPSGADETVRLCEQRDGKIWMSLYDGITNVYLHELDTTFTDGATLLKPATILTVTGAKFAIYKDQYIWVASGTTVKIYNYDTKALLASASVSLTVYGVSCSYDNKLYYIKGGSGYFKIGNAVFDGVSVITQSEISGVININQTYVKQLLIDRFGDLIILTNSGTSSTLLKYSSTGMLIDTVSLSVGTNKGAYGLQVYSSDNGTKCWVQFGNDLGTWRTEETTAQGQVFGAVSKIRNNGVTTYGSDMGGDNNYSVWCP